MSEIVRQQQPTMYFIGVSTSKSSIMRIFPLWMKELGRPDVVLRGIDLALHDSDENYRSVVAQIKSDPLSLGALVTTHKINLLMAARDMFDYLDPYADLCGEISSISKLEGRLEGHAKDPITCGLAYDAFVPDNHFQRTGAEILCLGAGGSATALVVHLARQVNPANQPRRVHIVNRSAPRLQALRQMIAALATNIGFELYCHTDPRQNDELMGQLPPGSLVINATGMGKDLPGSPVTDVGVFPENGFVWELNYRGELQFLHQAVSQQASRNLTIEDGWVYFLHGWSQVVAQVLHTDLSPAVFERLAAQAAEISVPALPVKRSGTIQAGA